MESFSQEVNKKIATARIRAWVLRATIWGTNHYTTVATLLKNHKKSLNIAHFRQHSIIERFSETSFLGSRDNEDELSCLYFVFLVSMIRIDVR